MMTRSRANSTGGTIAGILIASPLFRRFFHLLEDVVQIEARRFLSLRIFPERRQELSDIVLRGHQQEYVVDEPVVVRIRRNVSTFIRVGPKIEYLRDSQACERVCPNQQLSGGALLLEHDLEIVIPERDHLLIVVDVEESLSWTLLNLPGQIRDKIVAIEVNLVSHVANVVPGE